MYIFRYIYDRTLRLEPTQTHIRIREKPSYEIEAAVQFTQLTAILHDHSKSSLHFPLLFTASVNIGGVFPRVVKAFRSAHFLSEKGFGLGNYPI